VGAQYSTEIRDAIALYGGCSVSYVDLALH
jgi:hypothetical protein